MKVKKIPMRMCVGCKELKPKKELLRIVALPTVLIGGKFHGIVLGYSYEIYTSAINPGNGSHEIFIGYQMDLNLQKKGRNMHKSVRVL